MLIFVHIFRREMHIQLFLPLRMAQSVSQFTWMTLRVAVGRAASLTWSSHRRMHCYPRSLSVPATMKLIATMRYNDSRIGRTPSFPSTRCLKRWVSSKAECSGLHGTDPECGGSMLEWLKQWIWGQEVSGSNSSLSNNLLSPSSLMEDGGLIVWLDDMKNYFFLKWRKKHLAGLLISCS